MSDYAEGDHDHHRWLEVDGHTYGVSTPGAGSPAAPGVIAMNWDFDELQTGWPLTAEQAAAIIRGMKAARDHGRASGRLDVGNDLRRIIGAASDYDTDRHAERIDKLETR